MSEDEPGYVTVWETEDVDGWEVALDRHEDRWEMSIIEGRTDLDYPATRLERVDLERLYKALGEELGMAEEADRNARAYGWEIGRGAKLEEKLSSVSDDNPFMHKNWKDNVAK